MIGAAPRAYCASILVACDSNISNASSGRAAFSALNASVAITAIRFAWANAMHRARSAGGPSLSAAASSEHTFATSTDAPIWAPTSDVSSGSPNRLASSRIGTQVAGVSTQRDECRNRSTSRKASGSASGMQMVGMVEVAADEESAAAADPESVRRRLFEDDEEEEEEEEEEEDEEEE